MTRNAVISIDVDTLASIYKGAGCRRSAGYSYAEMEIGLENILHFFRQYDCPLTLFMVGNDLKFSQNIQPALELIQNGHEIGNHTMNHAQGFRFLSIQEKYAEIAAMDGICRKELGVKPVGFRAPGWNVSDDAIPILKDLGYVYDSSVFPTIWMPLLKCSHWLSMRSRSRLDRSTMGQNSYISAPTYPYRSSRESLGREGLGGLVEFPIGVSSVLRIPFTATFYLLFGWGIYRDILQGFIRRDVPVHFQFHLSDFVDYTTSEFVDQLPQSSQGVYLPKALHLSYFEKEKAFRRIMELIAENYHFTRMDEWSRRYDS